MKDDESKAGTFSQEQKPENTLNGHRETLCLKSVTTDKDIGEHTDYTYTHKGDSLTRHRWTQKQGRTLHKRGK